MAVTKIKPIKSTLSKALDYIQNPDKTDGKTLVSSFGCSYETADIEFEYTLSQARQKGNNLAFHLIQSFEPGEVDCEKAHASNGLLVQALSRLPAQKQEMLYLSFFKRMPQHEIGRRYGRSRSAAGYHIRKTIQQLYEEMEGLAHEE